MTEDEKTVLGKSVCNECGGDKVLVITLDKYEKQGYIKSRCLKCGIQEGEWLFGDDPEYLNKLSAEYHVTIKQLKKALAPYCKTPTNIQTTIVKQLAQLNPFFQQLYNVAEIIALDDGRTIRLHTRHPNKTINIDITYHHISDLYEVKATQVNGLTMQTKTLEDIKDVNVINLDETIYQIMSKHAF